MDPTTAAEWATYAAIASAIAALLSFFVAAFQLKTSERAHKIALFDKRLAIYDQINTLTISCLANGWNYINPTTYREHQQWLQLRKELEWLFPSELSAWLNENVGKAFLQYVFLQGQKADADTEEEKREYSKQWTTQAKKLSEAHDQFKEKFSPYLRMEK
ncbi:hypothetical protein ACSFBX_22245 [Variovorax sp. RB2P76]|uniref:hypothetical protein n=1 Tax=Variovorax sp. RB2P76 TaxID=3443736 RepID=UPI003F45F31C